MTLTPTRLLLLLGLVVALVIGLLGMHTVTSAMSHPLGTSATVSGTGSMPGMAAETGGSTVDPGALTSASDVFFSQPSPTGPPMAMICVLALLVAWMLVSALAARTRRSTLPPLRPAAATEWMPFTVAARRPPDLIALSISRT